ncbi:MAG: hypothetical protein HY718_05010, partial [Planctomycetes bacterium]|nr:hypothetical protein [Planctomycetota bacterium]
MPVESRPSRPSVRLPGRRLRTAAGSLSGRLRVKRGRQARRSNGNWVSRLRTLAGLRWNRPDCSPPGPYDGWVTDRREGRSPDLDALRRHAEASGWRTEPGAAILYGEQIVIRDGACRAVANFWPKRGTLSIQGPASPLLDALHAWQAEQGVGPRATGGSDGAFALPHIGVDEAGKGDWFGPLVVAAVEVDARTAELLRLLGVRDSKRVGSAALGEVATQVEQVIDEAHRRVVALPPRELNGAHAAAGNLNVLLADLHAEAASLVSRRTGTTRVVCD